MRHWASALGVRCGHCHTGGNPDTLEGVDFPSDEKWEKRTARAMFRMMQGVEADYLRQLEARPVSGGLPAEPALGLACATCHRGLLRPETLDALLARVLESEGLDAALRSYEDLRGKYLGRGSYDFSERPLNTLGERLLLEKRSQEARRVLELGARFNPDAAWLHHLLGDARLAEGDRPGALAAYERALVIEPGNDFTRKKADDLRAAMPPVPARSFMLPLEPNHSTIGFSIPIAGGITRVTGKFKDFEGRIVMQGDDPSRGSVEITIQASSIDTGIDDRDAHLREADFFDVAAHPLILFKSTRVAETAAGFQATGMLTLRGVAKEIVLPFRKTGLEWQEGRPVLGVSGELTLSRSEYGVGTGWRHTSIENFLGDAVRVEFFLWTRQGRSAEAALP
jgi:polyisoprenoid-binding protein YceI